MGDPANTELIFHPMYEQQGQQLINTKEKLYVVIDEENHKIKFTIIYQYVDGEPTAYFQSHISNADYCCRVDDVEKLVREGKITLNIKNKKHRRSQNTTCLRRRLMGN